MDKNFAEYLFSDTEFVDSETKEANTDLLKEFNDVTLSNNARGRLFIGSIRMVQKRTEPEICKRSSTVTRYRHHFTECYDQNFQAHKEFKEPLAIENEAFDQKNSERKFPHTWLEWQEYQQPNWRFTAYKEYFNGHFGKYFPDGYI